MGDASFVVSFPAFFSWVRVGRWKPGLSFIHGVSRVRSWDFLAETGPKKNQKKGLQVWEGGQGSLWLSMPWEVPECAESGSGS